MKKILFCVESLGAGGAEHVLSTIVNNLSTKDYDITVLTVVKTGVYLEEIEKRCNVLAMLPDYETIEGRFNKIRYKIEYKYIYHTSSTNVYRHYIKDVYDIEIGFIEGFATKLIAASTNPRSKKICWLHIDMIRNPYADNFYSSIEQERQTYNCYDSIVAVSESVKHAFEEKFRIYNKTTVVYNPIDCRRVSAEAMETSAPNRGPEIHLVTMGRLEKQKGFDRLLRTLAMPHVRDLEFHLWILGEGSCRKELERQIEESNLSGKVDLLGFQRNPYPWILAADLFVCTSRAEGFSLAIAEAMILGKPILSVDCAGPNELLDNGKYGKLIPNTQEAIDEAVYEMVCGEGNIDYLTDRAKARIDFFELSHIVQQIQMLL